MKSFLAAYVAEEPGVAALFGRMPDALLREGAEAAAWEPSLVAALDAHQARLGSNAHAPAHAAAIVTGQQPGLLTGPLYTIYKAATAIRLAHAIEETSGAACVPVFWCASEDHDFEEVREAHIFTKQCDTLTLRYAPEADVNEWPMYRVPAESSLHALIDQAAEAARGSLERATVAEFLHESLDASESFADWFMRILARLFRDTPLVLFAPHWPEARAAAAPIIEREILEPLATTRLLREGARHVESLGFDPQVLKREDECCFFLEVDGHRCKALYRDGRYRIPAARLEYSPDELAQVLHAEPGRFSPNVALRPIVQQHLFPTAAYVAGPGELAYWAQLKGVFTHFGLPMPVAYPRARAVLESLKARQLLEKTGLALERLTEPREALIEAALRAEPPNEASKAFAAHQQDITERIEAMRAELAQQDARAGKMAFRLAERTQKGLGRIERALLRADQDRLDAAERRVTRLCAELAPWRKPQERVYTICSFLFEYGWELVPRLTEELDIRSFTTQEIVL